MTLSAVTEILSPLQDTKEGAVSKQSTILGKAPQRKLYLNGILRVIRLKENGATDIFLDLFKYFN